MATAVWDLGQVGEAIAAPVRRARAWLDERGLTLLALLVGAAILFAALVAALVENTILDPNVTILGGEISPGNNWVALTDEILPGPAMGDIDSAIELRRHDGLLMGPTLDRIFLMKFRSDKVQIQRIKWYADSVLEIVFVADEDQVPKLRKSYQDVVIDYRRVDPK